MANERDVQFTPTPGATGIDNLSDVGSTAGLGTPQPRGDTGADQSRMQKTASAVKEKAEEVREKTADRIEERVSQQKHHAADSLSTVAQSLRSAGEQLPPDNGMSRYMVQAAAQVDNLAQFLNNREVAEMVDGVEDFARRQPAAFVGGAFALGVIGARFLKSSRRDMTGESGRQAWSTREPIGRVEQPHDAISRPGAPGYVPAEEREISGDGGAGYR